MQKLNFFKIFRSIFKKNKPTQTAESIKADSLPLHVGIIMDGNRRWAKKRNLPVSAGHSKGAETFKKLALYCNKIGLRHLTVYAFSTENWKRSEKEISALMLLFRKYLKMVMEEFKEENIRIKFIGDISRFSEDIKEMVKVIETETKNRTGLNLNIAMNYGSRAEILRAVRNISQKIESKKLKTEDINEQLLENNLYTKGQGDIDLIIRTAGEQRISNFLLWQGAYAEFYFTDVLWPDFSENEFNKAITEYNKRIRKFGGA